MSAGPAGTTVGVIGLGTMGRPIAHRLLDAAARVQVHSRHDTLRNEFESAGASWCGTPLEAASGAAVVLIVVATEPDLAGVLAGLGRWPASIGPRVVVCDLGTHSPPAVLEADAIVRAAGGIFLDTPISGGVEGALAGSLSLMAGGDVAALDRARPVLRTFASTIVHFGPVGSGQVAKACNQLLVGSTIEAVA